MRISDWSSDVCSSDLFPGAGSRAASTRSRASPASTRRAVTPSTTSPPTTKENDMRQSRVPRPNKILTVAAAAMLGIDLAATAQAAGPGMPWEEPLQQVLEYVQGTVAKNVAVIIIIVTGLTR